MLTVDDCNTILKKYGDIGLWYEIDFSQFDFVGEEVHSHEFYTIRLYHGYFEITINTDLFQGVYYLKDADGQIVQSFDMIRTNTYEYSINRTYSGVDFTLCIYLTTNPAIPYTDDMAPIMTPNLIPLSPTKVLVTNGVFDDKFYITGQSGAIYTVDDTVVQLESDEKGTFIRLPYANECTIGYKLSSWGINYKIIRVTFKELKTLPIISIPTLYRGTPQQIRLINADTEEEITEFQAYYNGKLLKDNIITVPRGEGNVAEITVDLKDERYPHCTVKLKVNVTNYTCQNQFEVMTAIQKGIKYIALNSSNQISLNGLEFNDMTIIWGSSPSFIFKNCIFNNSQIILSGTSYFDNGGNVFNNCNISSSTVGRKTLRMSSSGSVFNNCTVNSIRFMDYELFFTGTMTDCRFTRSVIISDGNVTLTNNEFDGISSKDYFPNFLYLTGEYTVTGNTFTLEGEWEELQYNMCIIKATNDFNPSNFIKQNNLQLNITYDSEPTNTFYYNLVDEDKIRAVKLQ